MEHDTDLVHQDQEYSKMNPCWCPREKYFQVLERTLVEEDISMFENAKNQQDEINDVGVAAFPSQLQ